MFLKASEERLVYHVVSIEYFPQQFRDGTSSFHGGVSLAQVHGYPQGPLTVHQPGRHGQDTLLHVGRWSQATQLLEGNHSILGREMKNECLQTSEDSRCLSYARAPILSAVLHFSVLHEVIVVLEIILNVSEHIRNEDHDDLPPSEREQRVYYPASSFFPGISLRMQAIKVLHKTAKLM